MVRTIFSDIILITASVIAYANPQIRQIETKIPDAVPDPYDEKLTQDKKSRTYEIVVFARSDGLSQVWTI
ncbi:exported protein of unknown function [Brevefilum fermentans]|uniref:Uncharacterized protein n=1 Tax=Candidatus Brevifilum fermentans TaxID=1986204 RepID=A0A1Y6K5J7_9CHLR|nr:exported protein of unknown function [Brevefilum fermentans]